MRSYTKGEGEKVRRSASKCEEGSRRKEERKSSWGEGRRRVNSFNIKQLDSQDSGYIDTHNIGAFFQENRSNI